jgi:hypothetical protein
VSTTATDNPIDRSELLELQADVAHGRASYLRGVLEETAGLPDDAYFEEAMPQAVDSFEGTIAVAALGVMAELRALRVELERLRDSR